MNLPTDLTLSLERALVAVRNEPRHALAREHRAAVWAAMGSFSERSSPRTQEGHRRRALLAIAAAERVLPLWEVEWPGDPLPHRVLAEARRHLDLDFSIDDPAWNLLEDAWLHIDNTVRKGFFPAMAGLSAVTALNTALADETFDARPSYKGPPEEELVDQEAAALAALALSQGAPADRAADPAKRLAFWEWYLTEAVPAAYRDGSLPPRSEGDP